jgi:seryl-tRNA synthetase
MRTDVIQHTIPLERPLPEFLAEEFAKRVFFASEQIQDFRLVEDEGLTTAVVVTTADDTPTEELADKLALVLRNDVLPQLVREPKVIWRSDAHAEVAGGTFDRLIAKEAAFPVAEGQVALGEPLLSLMDALDRVVRDIAVTEFGGCEHRYPTLIPIGALSRCGYFTSFPQYVWVASRLKADVDNYREFVSEASASQDIGADILSRCSPVDYCLPPTMCYHTFNQYTGRNIPDTLSVVTARGKSFRHEARYHRTLARLWDFTIREIVFLGARDVVLKARERFLNRGLELMNALGLSGRCEVATDPFFANADSSTQITSQRLLELKYEIQLDIGAGDSISIASFNFHERFFGESFGITLPDASSTFSGCVGFGLERLAFALVCQHGVDPLGWPESVRQALRWSEDQPLSPTMRER